MKKGQNIFWFLVLSINTMKYSFSRQNALKQSSFSFIKDHPRYLFTDISELSQVHPKPNVIRVSSEISRIQIRSLEASPKQPKIQRHHYQPRSQCICCSQVFSQRSSLKFLDDVEQNDGCCKLSKTKHQTSSISRVSQRQLPYNEDFFDSQIFNKILFKDQVSTQKNLHSNHCLRSPHQFAQTSTMSHVSSMNSGLKLGIRIIVNKIENIKKKRAAFKLIRHLKIIQFVFKLNYIVKVKSFLNMENAVNLMREMKKLAVGKQGINKIMYFCYGQQRALKAKAFLKLKMGLRSDKASLIPFAIILKKILREKMLKIVQNSLTAIKDSVQY